MKKANRTCISCRESTGSDHLLRLVLHPLSGKVVPDLKGNLPGRGAWVHPTSICLEIAQSRSKVLVKALRSNVKCGDLLKDVRVLLIKKILDLLSLTAAAGNIVGGHEQILEAMNQGKIRALILADNVADRTRGRLLDKSNDEIQIFELPVSSAELGFQVGKGPRAALGILSGEGGRRLIYQLRRRHDIG